MARTRRGTVMRELTSTVPDQLKELTTRKHAAAATAWRERRHLLETRDLTRSEVECFIDVAKLCKQAHNNQTPLAVLAGKTIAHIFYENSTRTRSSFEVAARALGADVLNLDTKVSSVTKGETIVDTARQLVAMQVAAIVQRHSASGSAHLLVRELGDKVHVLNAGDGWNGHPTQGLLDALTMMEVRPNLEGAKIAVVGDITHSRVARSAFWLLKTLGAQIHVAGPPTLIPPQLASFGIIVHNQLEPAIEGADFVMMLRLQLERQSQGLIPSIGEYKRLFRLDHQKLKLASPDVRVLHPGPVNRGIEMTDELVDDPYYSLIETQVTNGVATRMAAFYLLLTADA
jgi:aspartate carbamoyltransferase catalytic subunit